MTESNDSPTPHEDSNNGGDSTPQAFLTSIADWTKFLTPVLILVVMIMSVVVCTSEFRAREATLARYESNLNTESDAATKADQQLRRLKLHALMTVGAETEDLTLRGLIKEEIAAEPQDNQDQSQSKIGWISRFMAWLCRPAQYASSDRLFAVFTIASAVIGAVVVSLRQDIRFGTKEIGIGFATGFLVMAILRGEMLPASTADSQPFDQTDPFVVAVAAFLSGMFSDRVYALLRSVFTDFVGRLQRGFESNGNNDTNGG